MSAEIDMSRRDELEALLPFYLNGTLEGEDLAAVEAWLASDPQAAAALGEAELEFSGTTAANEAIRPPADALSRFTRALERQAGPAREPKAASFLSTMVARVLGLPAGLAWATATAAVLLLLAQATTGFLQDPGYEIAGEDGEIMKGPFALVSFKPEARMDEVAAFLSGNGAAIIGGPSATGVFRVAIPVKTVADYDRILGLIAAQPFVQSVVAGRKPRDGD